MGKMMMSQHVVWKPFLTRFLVSVIVLVELGESTTNLSLEAEVQESLRKACAAC